MSAFIQHKHGSNFRRCRPWFRRACLVVIIAVLSCNLFVKNLLSSTTTSPDELKNHNFAATFYPELNSKTNQTPPLECTHSKKIFDSPAGVYQSIKARLFATQQGLYPAFYGPDGLGRNSSQHNLLHLDRPPPACIRPH